MTNYRKLKARSLTSSQSDPLSSKIPYSDAVYNFLATENWKLETYKRERIVEVIVLLENSKLSFNFLLKWKHRALTWHSEEHVRVEKLARHRAISVENYGSNLIIPVKEWRFIVVKILWFHGLSNLKIDLLTVYAGLFFTHVIHIISLQENVGSNSSFAKVPVVILSNITLKMTFFEHVSFKTNAISCKRLLPSVL